MQLYIRYIILYAYGGIWFDLDIFFFRSLDPLLLTYPDKTLVYAWATEPYPNGALFVQIQPRSVRFANIIAYLTLRGRGFCFPDDGILHRLPLPYTVLPCVWFDADWMPNHFEYGFGSFFTTRPKSLDRCSRYNFHPGAFVYHWHIK